MKRFILFLIVCLSGVQSHAQTKYGVKAGASITSMKNEGWTDKQPKMGVLFGFIAEANITSRFFLKPELLFTTKGFRFTAGMPLSKGILNVNYVSIPFLAGFRLEKNISVLAGPEFGYLQDAKSKHDGRIYDLTNNYSRFDLCLNVGLQYKLTKTIGAELRYSHGMVDLSGAVIPHPLIDYIGVYKARNQSLQLNLFYLFSRK